MRFIGTFCIQSLKNQMVIIDDFLSKAKILDKKYQSEAIFLKNLNAL